MSTLNVVNGGNGITEGVSQCIREVYGTYGDRVDVVRKAKSLHKFGKNDDIPNNAFVTVYEGGDGTNEVYQTTNSIDRLSSSSTSDVGQVVKIEGHTVTGTGEDATYSFAIQEVTINGQNKVVLPTPLARVSRAFNNSGTDLVGDVYIYRDGAITNGVPNDLTTVHLRVLAGDNQTFKAATTFSNTDYFFMTEFGAGVTSKASSTVDFRVQIRGPGKVFRTIQQISASQSGGNSREFHPPIIIPKNYDIRILAKGSGASTGVYAGFEGYLATVTEAATS